MSDPTLKIPATSAQDFRTAAFGKSERSGGVGDGGFVNLLQAFDQALADTVQPHDLQQPATRPDAPAHDDEPAQQDTAPRSGNADTARDKPVRESASKTGHAQTARHGQDKQAAETNKADTATDELQVASGDQTVPEAVTESPMQDTVVETLPTATDLGAMTEKPKLPSQNPLAGEQMAIQHPKIVASQKAMPQTETSAAAIAASAAVITDTADSVPEIVTTSAQAEVKVPEAIAPLVAHTGKPQAKAQQTLSQSGQETILDATLRVPTPSADKSNQTNGEEGRHAAHLPPDPLASSTVSADKSAPMTSPNPAIAAAQLAANTTKTLEAASLLRGKLETAGLHIMDGGINRPLNGYNGTAQLTSARSAQSAGLRTLELVEQVAVKLNQQAKSGLDHLSIQLRPTDLGRIDIKLQFQDGSVTGLITADQQSTLDLLVKDQRVLERALQDSGLRADSGSLSFQLRDQSGQSAGQQGKAETASRGGQDFNLDLVRDADAGIEIGDMPIITADRVNLRI